ncbi:MAG TPA: TadG family pilus assembly protein [Planctomycetaceae bacterium]
MNAIHHQVADSWTRFRLRGQVIAFHHRRGAVLTLVALLLVVLLGCLAFSIDLGYIQVARAQLQTAADAGALAGARGLTICCPSTALSEAQRVAQLNSVMNAKVSVVSAQDVTLGTWDDNSLSFSALSGSAQSGANAVKVTCQLSAARGNALTLFFARVFGVNTQDLSATAIAKSTPVTCGAFIGLDYVKISGGSSTDSYSSSSGYSKGSTGSQGNVCSNAKITMSGDATVNGDAHPGPGYSVSTSGAASVSGSKAALTQPLTEAAIDPGTAATVSDNNKIPLSSRNKNPVDSHGNFDLSANDSVTISPGTYYFTSLTLSGSSSLLITGKTIIYVAGKVDVSGGTMTNSSEIPSNLQIYAMGPSVTISGGSNMYGVVYAPTTDITRSGGSDFFGMMVGKSLTLSGGGGLHADTALTGIGSSTKKASLVQ